MLTDTLSKMGRTGIREVWLTFTPLNPDNFEKTKQAIYQKMGVPKTSESVIEKQKISVCTIRKGSVGTIRGELKGHPDISFLMRLNSSGSRIIWL